MSGWSMTMRGRFGLTDTLRAAYRRRLDAAGIRIVQDGTGIRSTHVPRPLFGSRQVDESYEAWAVLAVVDGEEVRLGADNEDEAIMLALPLLIVCGAVPPVMDAESPREDVCDAYPCGGCLFAGGPLPHFNPVCERTGKAGLPREQYRQQYPGSMVRTDLRILGKGR